MIIRKICHILLISALLLVGLPRISVVHAAIAFTNLGASTGTATNPDINDSTDASSYSNSSWTPPTTGIIIAIVHNRVSTATANEPTISGNSLTWTSIVTRSQTNARITIFAADASGATTGVTTVDMASQVQFHAIVSFYQVTGVDISGGIASAFVQTPVNSGTTGTGSVTLASAANSANRPISAFYHQANEATTHQTNWTELDDLSATGALRGFDTQYRDDTFDTAAAATWTSSTVAWVGVAAELKALTNSAPSAPTTLYVNERATTAQSGVTNPVAVGDGTPVFSAVYADSDAGDIANKYEVIVYSNSSCTTQVWDSGSAGTSMTNCTQGNRCSDITFAGTALPYDGTTYYWKIKYWDDTPAEGSFSDCTATFTILGPADQMRHGNYFFNKTTERVFTW